MQRLTSALFISLLLHAVLLGALALNGGVRPGPSLPLEVEVFDLPSAPPPRVVDQPAAPQQPALSLPEHQIVAVPDHGEDKAPEKSRFLSERDVTVREQMVRRGDGGHAAEASDAPVPETVSQQSARPPARVRRLPTLDELLSGAGAVVAQNAGPNEEEASEDGRIAAAPKKEIRRRDLLKYGDVAHAARGRPGLFDFLPDVREGDVTLLNTKAEKFAPFVRRVGIRVFQNFIIFLRRELSQISASAQETVTYEAIMSPGGNMISLVLKERSPSTTFSTDRILQRACQDAFFDHNPPRGAEADDGNIHFLLSAHVVATHAPDGRLIGYRALFSAGLL